VAAGERASTRTIDRLRSYQHTDDPATRVVTRKL